jgi:CBS domain-containing protein
LVEKGFRMVGFVMEIEDIMIHKVVTVDPNATVKNAAKLMNRHEIGCLIAIKQGKALGIMTERDLLKKIVEQGMDPEKTKVHQIMSKRLVVGAPHMEIADAVRLMLQKKIKKLPIVEEGTIIGLITLTDIARTARIEPQMIGVIKELRKTGWLPPKHMKKVLDFYVV